MSKSLECQVRHSEGIFQMKNKIAIVGTRGIPNLYGGFEQFAEYVSVGLKKYGFDVAVYSPAFHPYKEPQYNGVEIIRKWCPEGKMGAAAHILYDYLCLKDAVRREFDVVLELGYQSSAISMILCARGRTKIITNMDGMEWKRKKWSRPVKSFTRWAEKVGVQYSQALVSDNIGIQEYLHEAYGKSSTMIPYGAEVFDKPDSQILQKYGLDAENYFILIARMEPENNIEAILDGYLKAGSNKPFIVVGNHTNKYGKMLCEKYANTSIRFLGGIYDINSLNNLRYYSKAYFHGHSVGGTNPSLLEAMASGAFIIAHGNIFNRSVLGSDALYFMEVDEVASIIIDQINDASIRGCFIENNLKKIREIYRWDLIVEQYAKLIEKVINEDTHHYPG